MSARSQRYTAVILQDNVFQLSSSSAKVMKALASHQNLTYSQLKKRTRMPENSLYVHVSRLKKSKLVVVSQDKNRVTHIKAVPALEFPATKYVG